MNTRTIQTHSPSGCTYVLEYDGHNTIIGVSGDLHHEDVDALVNEPDLLWYIETDPDDALWANDQQWHAPKVEV